MTPSPAPPAVLRALADGYARTRAARTGSGRRDYFIDYEDLLTAASSATGEARVCAERDLIRAENDGLLKIDRHRRTRLPLKVRFFITQEKKLFARIGQTPPGARRGELAELFDQAKNFHAPEIWKDGWRTFCHQMAEAAHTGQALAPFARDRLDETTEILQLLPRLLSWEGESLTRFASTLLCGDSKRLEQLQTKLETCLARITGEQITRFPQIGITPNERAITLHGPVEFLFPEGVLNAALLRNPFRLDRRDLDRAEIRTGAVKCLTVENAAMLQELAKVNAGILLAGSGSEGGFAHSALVTFLSKLPATVELHHFGDSDPAGFDILRDLRRRTGRTIHSAWMRYRPAPNAPTLTRQDQNTLERLINDDTLAESEKAELRKITEAGNKGRFEQESLGPPARHGRFTQTRMVRQSRRELPITSAAGVSQENCHDTAGRSCQHPAHAFDGGKYSGDQTGVV